MHFIQHCSLWVVKKRNGLQLSNLDVPESLLRDKDEYEAYWEHYISVKEELVENILQARHQRGKAQIDAMDIASIPLCVVFNHLFWESSLLLSILIFFSALPAFFQTSDSCVG